MKGDCHLHERAKANDINVEGNVIIGGKTDLEMCNFKGNIIFTGENQFSELTLNGDYNYNNGGIVTECDVEQYESVNTLPDDVFDDTPSRHVDIVSNLSNSDNRTLPSDIFDDIKPVNELADLRSKAALSDIDTSSVDMSLSGLDDIFK